MSITPESVPAAQLHLTRNLTEFLNLHHKEYYCMSLLILDQVRRLYQKLVSLNKKTLKESATTSTSSCWYNCRKPGVTFFLQCLSLLMLSPLDLNMRETSPQQSHHHHTRHNSRFPVTWQPLVGKLGYGTRYTLKIAFRRYTAFRCYGDTFFLESWMTGQNLFFFL